MKYIDEFREAHLVKGLSKAINEVCKNNWQIMEICGGQTHSIFKYGIDKILPPSITLLHGPGCPVCVTPIEIIDFAIAIALSSKKIIFCTFGDMLRVPGSQSDLMKAKANGADIRIVYSPLDALKLAESLPKSKIVFFAIGFETTIPASALSISLADKKNINNFFLLCTHVLVSPAMISLLSSPNNQIQGFLAAGHVCSISGYKGYKAIAEKFSVPIIITGFEPTDILLGIYYCLLQLEEGKAIVENKYSRCVQENGNLEALSLIQEIFSIVDLVWRGIGNIPQSSLVLRPKYQDFDAFVEFKDIFDNKLIDLEPYCGKILRGKLKPNQCPNFGNSCKPESPIGAPMVSSEGACAAYYHYLAK